MYIKKRVVSSMLLRFKFKNHKSFAEETVLDLTATNIKEHAVSLIEKNGNKVLPVAAVFGANASGKSNLFSAFSCMVENVIDQTDKNDINSLYKPFIFNGSTEKEPSEFEVCINIEDSEYRYGFTRNRSHIIEEWLFVKKFFKDTKAKEKLVFYRKGKKITLEKLNLKEKNEIDFVHSMIEENKLLITAIGRRERSIYSKVYEWFMFSTGMQNFSDEFDENMSMQYSAEFLFEHKKNLEDVITLLMKVDNSISNIEIIPETDSDMNQIYKIYSYHNDMNNNLIKVPFESESSGTKKMFALASWLFFSLNAETVLWVDELDAKLHPLILRYIVKLYRDRDFNVANGQLIFSSHNLVCLDSSDLRRDEIWFVEKNNQISDMYSLYDYNEEDNVIRSDLNFGKHYLAGRFGAIPFQNVGEEYGNR